MTEIDGARSPSVLRLDGDRQVASVELSFAPAATIAAGLPDSDRPAIRGTGADDTPLTHSELKRFLGSFSALADWGIGSADVVAVLMPNGPELAVALLAVMTHCIAAPLEPTLSEADLRDAFQQMNVKYALALRQHRVANLSLVDACKACSVKLCEVAPSGTHAGLFVDPDGKGNPNVVSTNPAEKGGKLNTDTCLLLRTSGTTSKPKVVPLNLRGLYAGSKSIGMGLGLAETDVCLNVMPYTHIGGISCSLLATLFMGGSVICAPSFNVELFVDWLGSLKPTWYYAVPTIHKAVLLHCAGAPPEHSLRIVRSGAAALPDADAQQLKTLFGCAVLPTYSMSECMPVAQPPVGYALERPGSVGQPLASSLCIADEDGQALPFGVDGQVCVRGPVVTMGYLDNAEANAECFFGEPDAEGFRWFKTGDVGHLDAEGFLTLSGRSKELIKRGGEQVSPYEVEELLAKHPAVEVALVFGVPNEFWGEEVAAAVVRSSQVAASIGDGALERVGSKVDLPRFQAEKSLVGPAVQVGNWPQVFANFLAQQGLPASKAPRQYFLLDSAEGLPKTRTGKYMRAGLAKHLNAAAVDTQAASLVQSKAGGSLVDGDRGQAKVVRPDKSVMGLRFFLALWVIFMHVGEFPDSISAWRSGSLSMMSFFVLAGFQLSAGVTRPIEDKREFYKNRIVAAHPLYALVLIFTVPLFFLDTGSEPSVVDSITGFFMAFFYQLAWPWGMMLSGSWMHFNGPLWFSSAYIFCILLFPSMHRALYERWFFRLCCASRKPLDPCCCGDACPVYCCWPVCGCLSIIGAVNYIFFALTIVVGGALAEFGEEGEVTNGLAELVFFGGYCFPPVWAGIFFLGCLLWQLFELGGQSELGRWPHWGKVSDGVAGLFVLIILILFPVMGSDVSILLGALISRPTRGFLGLVLIWIYAMATGQGCVARFMRSPFLVKYLAPASYAMYLFHFPVAHYLNVLTGHGKHEMPFGPAWMFCLVSTITTLMAVVAQHLLNGPLTATFLRAIELCSCCGSRRVELAENEDTLSRIISAIHSLSGHDVDGTTDLGDCGLDSFGTAALLGVLRARIPGLALSAVQIYQVRTVGELAAKIDEKMGRQQAPHGKVGSGK